MVRGESKFKCQHCGKKFVLERAYMNHECEDMRKSEILKTIDGQAAYVHYSRWMEKKKRKAPPIETFLHSTYFRSFLKFAVFVRDVNLPNSEKYIDLMIEKEIAPILWTHSECYAIYLQWNDNKSPALEQVDISVNTILDLAEQSELSPVALFNLLHIRDIIQLLQERKLSPWFLLCSKKFKTKLAEATIEDNKELLKLIGINYWAAKLEDNVQIVKQIKIIISALDL